MMRLDDPILIREVHGSAAFKQVMYRTDWIGVSPMCFIFSVGCANLRQDLRQIFLLTGFMVPFMTGLTFGGRNPDLLRKVKPVSNFKELCRICVPVGVCARLM